MFLQIEVINLIAPALHSRFKTVGDDAYIVPSKDCTGLAAGSWPPSPGAAPFCRLRRHFPRKRGNLPCLKGGDVAAGDGEGFPSPAPSHCNTVGRRSQTPCRLRCPKFAFLALARRISTAAPPAPSLHPPQAALGLGTTKLSHISKSLVYSYLSHISVSLRGQHR